jgi:hypothetical protein
LGFKDNPALLDNLDLRALKVNRVLQVSEDPKDPPVLADRLVLPEHLGQPDQLVRLAHRDLLGQLDPRAM